MKNKIRNFLFLILSFLLSFNILVWIIVFDFQKSEPEVTFFDVSQGDAIFIEIPPSFRGGRQQILIDGGPSSVILEKLAKEMPFYDRTIDLVILTHPERDHLSGLNEVLKRYKIKNILWTGVVRDTAEYKEWKKIIDKEKAQIFIAQAGQKITCKSCTRTKFNVEQEAQMPMFTLYNPERIYTEHPCEFFIDILYPFQNLEGQEFKNSNDTSIVAKLVFSENSFLFTGDISSKIEQELISEYLCSDSCKFANLKSTVLKIAHHGSKYSSSEDFLKNVSPQLAVIQVGKNSYNLPAEEVLARLENFGIRVLRTDKNGDIKIINKWKN